MYFRFASLMIIAVSVAMAGVELEKRMLVLRRELSRQHFRSEVLLEQHARLRLRAEQLAAPHRLLQTLEEADRELSTPEVPSVGRSEQLPLLLWRRGEPTRRSTHRKSAAGSASRTGTMR